MLVERSGPDGTTIVLIDTSPDLREQLLGEDVGRIDGVLLTHDHADHLHGIDDLRPMTIHMRKRIKVWADAATSRTVAARFDYCFRTPPGGSYPPIVDEHRIELGRAVEIPGPGGIVTAMPFDMAHGDTRALGFRFGDAAYASDVSAMPEESIALLGGLELLILDALRYKPHPTHLSVHEALALIARLKPERAVLTNLHSDVDYATLAAELPPHIVPAYDGLKLEVASA